MGASVRPQQGSPLIVTPDDDEFQAWKRAQATAPAAGSAAPATPDDAEFQAWKAANAPATPKLGHGTPVETATGVDFRGPVGSPDNPIRMTPVVVSGPKPPSDAATAPTTPHAPATAINDPVKPTHRVAAVPAVVPDASRTLPERNPQAHKLTGLAKKASDVFEAMANNPVETATALPLAPIKSAFTAGRYIGQQISEDPSADADASRSLGIDPVTGKEAAFAGAQTALMAGGAGVLGRLAGEGTFAGATKLGAPEVVAKGLAGTAHVATEGGSIGAAYDPEHPGRGAAIGAGLSLLANEVGGVLRRRILPLPQPEVAAAPKALEAPPPEPKVAEARVAPEAPAPEAAAAEPDFTVEQNPVPDAAEFEAWKRAQETARAGGDASDIAQAAGAPKIVETAKAAPEPAPASEGVAAPAASAQAAAPAPPLLTRGAALLGQPDAAALARWATDPSVNKREHFDRVLRITQAVRKDMGLEEGDSSVTGRDVQAEVNAIVNGAAAPAPSPASAPPESRRAAPAPTPAPAVPPGKVLDDDGVVRHESARTPGGTLRPVSKVSTSGLLDELLELEQKRAKDEALAPYELRDDENFHTSGIPQIVSTKQQNGRGSVQSEALQRLRAYAGVTDRIHAELATRMPESDIWSAIEDRRAFHDERAGAAGEFSAVQRGNEITDESGRVLFEPSPDYGPDLFGNTPAPSKRDQASLFGEESKAGTEGARSLAETERAARAELSQLRQQLPLARADARAPIAARIAQLEKLVNRDKAITPDELAHEAAGTAAPPAPPEPSQGALFEPDPAYNAPPAPPKDSPAFKQWFGDSKVVDAHGNPLVVYHGAPDVRGIFAEGFRGFSRGDVFFASADRSTAATYADDHRAFDYQNAEPGVIPLYVSIRNPMVVDAGGRVWSDTKHFVDQAKAAGHDGIIIRNTRDHYQGDNSKTRPTTVYAWFSSAQAKSALSGPMKSRVDGKPIAGTGPNRGTFDATDPNILRERPAQYDREGQVTDRPAFKRWFGESKVVDAEGKPLRVYHGTQRSDRFGPRILASRATSGPMPFFTDDPAVASRYAEGKQDTSVPGEELGYDHWFRVKLPGARTAEPITRVWWRLPDDVRAKITALAPRVTTTDDGEHIILGPESETRGNGGYDLRDRDSHGNPLGALVNAWLQSGALFNDEWKFLDVLRLAGFPYPVDVHDPQAGAPGVTPVYLSIQHPLVTTAIPPDVLTALEARAARVRFRRTGDGTDPWDKRYRAPGDWLAALKSDVASGANSYAWTSIPDWVTDTLKGLGYDGIQDTGGKMGGVGHTVWIPFEAGQIKSAFGNRGTFDRGSDNILREPVRAYHGTPHRFDRFSLDKIGSGEGNQAYGHGLYFAGRKEIAAWYRESLTRQRLEQDPTWNAAHKALYAAVRAVDNLGFDSTAQAVDAITKHPDWATRWAIDPEEQKPIADALAAMQRRHDELGKGSLFHVGLPDDETMLAWDEPLSEQPEVVKKALAEFGLDLPSEAEVAAAHDKWQQKQAEVDAGKSATDWEREQAAIEARGLSTPEAQRAWIQARNGATDARLLAREAADLKSEWERLQAARSRGPGASLYRAVSRRVGHGADNPAAEASRALLAKGVTGIRYLNGTSRNAAPVNLKKYEDIVAKYEALVASDPSDLNRDRLSDARQKLRSMQRAAEEARENYNYVVFDDNAIQIHNVEERQRSRYQNAAQADLFTQPPESPAAQRVERRGGAMSFGSPSKADAVALSLVKESPKYLKITAAGLPTTADRLAKIKPANVRAWVDLRGAVLRSADDVFQLLRPFREPRAERIHVLLLDDENKVLAHTMETAGAVGFISVGRSPQEIKAWSEGVMGRAKRLGATRAIIGHNHPSGNPTPSPEDIAFTHGLGAVWQLDGVNLVGHIVIDHDVANWIRQTEPGVFQYARVTLPDAPVDWVDERAKQVSGPGLAGRLLRDAGEDGAGLTVLHLDGQNQVLAVAPHRQRSVATIGQWLPDEMRGLGARRVIIGTNDATARTLRELATERSGQGADAGHWSNDVTDVIIMGGGNAPLTQPISLANAGEWTTSGPSGAWPNPAAPPKTIRLFEPEPSYGRDAEPEGADSSDATVSDRAASALPGARSERADAGTNGRRAGADEAGRVPERDGVAEAPAVEPADRASTKRGAEPPPTVAASRVAKFVDDLKIDLAPHARSEEAGRMGRIVNAHTGEQTQRLEQAHHALRKFARSFDRMPESAQLDFIDRMEQGQPQATPSLTKAAALIRDLLDTARDEIRALGTGKLDQWLENYFPHIWKDPEAAAPIIGRILGKRPLEGPKSFLKRRSIPTTKEGIEAGLVPVTTNPVDLTLLKLKEMRRYLAAHRILQQAEADGIVKYVPATEMGPEGWRRIEDRIGTVFGKPSVEASEAFDKQIRDGLQSALDRLGVTHERRPRTGQRGALGYAKGGEEIVTKFGTDDGVLMHELGHILDARYGLWNRLGRNLETVGELQALAKLRHESGEATRSFTKYVQKPDEQIANALHALLHAPERMAEVAPNSKRVLEQFLASRPELKPLLDIKPSLELATGTTEIPVPGLVVRGHYWAPEPVTNVLHNYLSPGLRGKAWYGIYGGLNNGLNQAQLGLSAFHVGFTSLDAAVSQATVGLQHMTHGRVLKGARMIATYPVAPVTTMLRGHRLMRAYLNPENASPELVRMVRAITQAGGRAKQDSFYSTGQAHAFMKALRRASAAPLPGAKEFFKGTDFDNAVGEAALRFVPAVFDLAAKPVMEFVVPRQKLGVFMQMAERALTDLPEEATADDVLKALNRAWDSVDNRLGQLVYDRLFWNKTFKDLAMVSVRSVGWNLGTIREIGGGAVDLLRMANDWRRGRRPELTERAAYDIMMPFVVGLTGAVITYLLTGEGPKELKDYFYIRTGRKNVEGNEERVQLPSYMKDVAAYKRHPVETIEHKVSPGISTLIDMLHNEDFYGDQIRNADDPFVQQMRQVVEYLAQQVIPFGVRNAQEAGKRVVDPRMKVAGFVGVTAAPRSETRSDAQNKIMEYLGGKAPPGSTPEQRDARNARGDLMTAAREGTLASAKLDQAQDVGALSDRQRRTIERVQDGDADIWLDRFNRLSADEALRVYKLATPAEQAKYRESLESKLIRAGREDDLDALPPIHISSTTSGARP